MPVVEFTCSFQSGSCCSIPKCGVLSTIVCLFILFTYCYCQSFFASRLLITPLICWALFMHMDYFDIIFYLRLSLHRVTSVLLDTKWKAEESTTKKFKICQIYKEYFRVYCFDVWWLMSYLRCACSIGIVVSNTYCVVFVLVLYLVYGCV